MLPLLLLAVSLPQGRAKTDRDGCTWVEGTYTPTWGTSIAPWATRTWYVPDTGEICSRPDCGGGRAPVKTDVLGCDSYEGTSIYVPQFLDLESLKLETPSAVLLDEPPRTWTPTVTTIESTTGDDVNELETSTNTGPTGETKVEETGSAGDEEEEEDEGDSAAPTDAAALVTVGGVIGVVAGAAVLGFL